jgi:hypothetical protein
MTVGSGSSSLAGWYNFSLSEEDHDGVLEERCLRLKWMMSMGGS